jgi:TetR/AcrR family transcriptional regulator, cholesterol catabolism regulator
MIKETEKHQYFYKVALDLIKEKGFKALTMRDFATKLNCDVANIYNYVKSKDALLEVLLFQISDKFHVGISEIKLNDEIPIDKIKSIITLHVKLTFEYPNQVALLINEWRFLKPESQIKFIEFRKNYEDQLKSILVEGIQKGQIKSTNVEFTCNCLLSSLRWIYSWHDPNNKSQNELETQKMMKEFVLRGVMG